MEFNTFDDVLDFAILQEKAAQTFYANLASRALDPEVREFCFSMVGQELEHEENLRSLKLFDYDLAEPDMEAFHQSGYLDAIPVNPELTLREAIELACTKERSARLLYMFLAERIKLQGLSRLFEQLASAEKEHADYFDHQYQVLCTGES